MNRTELQELRVASIRVRQAMLANALHLLAYCILPNTQFYLRSIRDAILGTGATHRFLSLEAFWLLFFNRLPLSTRRDDFISQQGSIHDLSSQRQLFLSCRPVWREFPVAFPEQPC